MRATGIIRKVDELNRIVIPHEICQSMGIKKHTPLEVFVDNESIILRKYQPGCSLCNSMNGLKYFKGKFICVECRDTMPE